MADWLELELAEELRPAAAPDELWERVRGAAEGRVPRTAHRLSARQPSWTAWPIAAIITMMIAAATLWLVAKGQEPALDLRQLAIQELRAPGPMDLSSSDPAQIQAWMLKEAGVECNVPVRTGARLIGARVIRKGGTRIAALTYQAGGETATLLVARANAPGDFGHGQLQWQAQGQSYALASSGRAEAACLLCHAAL